MIHKVIIIGSGPAGWTAALYAARANLAPVLIAGLEPGGQLMTTSEVENYPGFEHGIMGPELMAVMQKQALRFGATVVNAMVAEAQIAGRPFRVTTDAGETFECLTLILATGAEAKRLGLASEKQLFGKGVSACATCDGFFFKDKKVVVVGGGDSAMEESTYLTKFAREVYVAHRRGELRASKIMQERAKKNPKIKFIWNTEVIEVLGVEAGHVTGVKLKNVQTGKVEDFPCDGVFAAIGHEPNTKLVQGKLELDVKGYIITQDGTTATSVPGVFAAGDVVDHRYRQAVTAAGTGCMAAMDAEKWIESNL